MRYLTFAFGFWQVISKPLGYVFVCLRIFGQPESNNVI